MTTNDKKLSPEDFVNDIFSTFFSNLGKPASAHKVPAAPTVNPVEEINRLLKKAEESEYSSETAELLQIVDRHIKILELALAYQQ